MADFVPVIKAYLDGRHVKCCPLIELKFRDGVKHYWGGGYDLPTIGKVWKTTNDFAQIDGIQQGSSFSNSTMTLAFSMAVESGVGSEIWDMAHSADVGKYRRRVAILYLAFFDDDWQLLAEPYAWQSGLMMAMPFDDKRDGDNRRLQQVKIQAVSIFCWRSGTHNDPYYSDRSQQTRHNGDKGFQFLTSIQRVQFPSPWR